MHEHILCDLRSPAARDQPQNWPELDWHNRFDIDYHSNRHQPNMWLDDDEVAAFELERFAAFGGGTIVELSVGGLCPQPDRLTALSQGTGVNIVFWRGLLCR